MLSLDNDKLKKLVLTRPIPDRLIQSLAVAPLVPPHEIDMWVRCGGRITNPKAHSRKKFEKPTVSFPKRTLAKRELEALQHIAEGANHKEAAFKMGVSSGMLTMYLAQAKFRLGAKTVEQAMVAATNKGLIRVPDIAVTLSAEEQVTLAMVYEGASANEIAAVTDTPLDTVKRRLRRAKRKTGANTTWDAARMIMEAA